MTAGVNEFRRVGRSFKIEAVSCLHGLFDTSGCCGVPLKALCRRIWD